MVALRPAVIGAVIRKDFLSLWPMVLGALLLPICLGSESVMTMGSQAKSLVAMIGALAMFALTLALVQQDGFTTARHDWLTRPIGVANLLAAKAIFLCLTLAIPMFIAQLFYDRAEGHVWAEAVLSGLSTLTAGLFVVVPVIMLGLVTASLAEAAVIAFGLAIVGVTSSNVFHANMDSGGGPLWIADAVTQALAIAFCFAVLVVLLMRKNGSAARLLLILGAVFCFAVSRYFPVGAATALQGLGGSPSAAAEALVTTVAEPCRWTDLQGAQLRSPLQVTNAPPRWRLEVDQVSVRYLTADGKGMGRARAHAWFDDQSEHGRVFVADQLSKEARPASMRWTYSLTLLEPRVSRDLVADGRRRYVQGLGYCEASRYPDAVEAVCHKPFSQPAAMTVHLKDRPETACPDCGRADYTPAILEGFGSTQRAMQRIDVKKTPLPARPVVTVTTYEARTHFLRKSVTGAPAGDTAPLCGRGR